MMRVGCGILAVVPILFYVPGAYGAETPNSAVIDMLPKDVPAHGKELSPTPVDESMSDLLKHGYEVANVSSGLIGVIYTLRRGTSWVSCTIGQFGKLEDHRLFSQCEQIS